MPAWAIASVIWAVSLPVALRYARQRGFIATSDPIVLFRVPIVCFTAPAVAIVAVLDAVLDRLTGSSG